MLLSTQEQVLKRMIKSNSTEEFSVLHADGVNSQLVSHWLGLMDYRQATQLQNSLYENLRESIDGAKTNQLGTVLGLEHPEVITLGKRGRRDEDVLPKMLLDTPVVEVDRGGQATIHSPGQLIIYPVINLRLLRLGVRDYVALLEDVTIQALSQLGITADRGFQNGVFTSVGKIAFIGVRVQHGITTHGISINFSNDLSIFEKIRACGVSSAQFDLISNYKAAQNLQISQFFRQWQSLFCAKLAMIAGISPCPSSQSLVSLESSNMLSSSVGVVGSAPP